MLTICRNSAFSVALTLLSVGPGCGGPPSEEEAFALAGQCISVHAGGQSLARDGERFRFAKTDSPAHFTLKAADLGVFLLYDADRGYVLADNGQLQRAEALQSDVTLIDDSFVSGAEWEVVTRRRHWTLQSRKTGQALGVDGLVDPADAARITFEEATGCAEPPELTLDASGTVERTTFDDGDLFGIADTHMHLMSNWGFGGGGLYHGAPFHRLGVEHALGDCAAAHGEAGRKDFMGFAYDALGIDGDVDITSVLPSLLQGELSDDNHLTAGYPDFPDWPDAVRRSTHQTAYHRWLERAHLAGLRLLVQHATTNAVICQLSVGAGGTPIRYPCDDMVAVDRSIDEVYAMERYIDAQAGGPGEGWFRVVGTPQQAREVIAAGKMAVILGIETSDLFGCRLVPRPGDPVCDEAYVTEQLDAYYERGIRAIFPVHKYDSQFSAGDGDRSFIELGNFLNSGHFSNFVTGDCPDLPTVFDSGPVVFGGLNEPRKDFLAPPPNDLSSFEIDPMAVALPYLGRLIPPGLEGDYCQNHGLTPLGEFLIEELMKRGMIVELDHLPRRSYARAFEMLQAASYPAMGTHGNTNDDKIYALGGLSKTRIEQCREAGRPGALLDSLQRRVAAIEAVGGYPAEGLGFDLNGFAGARAGRFAEGVCPEAQADPVTYPFRSWAGDVEFTEPSVGNRPVDFNQEGFVHIGMLPELIEDARIDAASADDLEPLFRSAEGYVRMWERAIARSQAL
ncbi:MAG: dipeptidase [Myxococcales bacterium]|nr:dipeptidase [Myxococcales bacterium]